MRHLGWTTTPSLVSFILVGGILPSITSFPWSDGQVTNVCEPCSDGTIPSNNNKEEDSACQDLVEQSYSLIAWTPTCADLQLELFQKGCCGEQPPRERCTICPDGSSFLGERVVPNFNPNEGDFSCTDLNSDVKFLDYLFESGTCSDTLLRRSAVWCGCPGIERQCSLCPNGQPPPDPMLVDPVYYGWDCHTFDFVSSYFSSEECVDMVNTIFEFDAPSYCGCSSSEESYIPIPQPQVCDLCPPGQIIANPHLILESHHVVVDDDDDDDTSSSSFTCRELALSTRYIPTEAPCERALAAHQSNGYISACCAPIEHVSKRYGGTSSSSSSPTVSAWWLGFTRPSPPWWQQLVRPTSLLLFTSTLFL